MAISTTELTKEFATLAEQLRRSTVQVRGYQDGIGSGVIWSPDGVVITNAHVIRGNSALVELFDGRVLEARVTARNDQRDLAALRVDSTDLPAATIGDSDRLRVGELVFAVGNPLGMTGAVTTGIIHNTGSSSFSRRHWIQADVQLAPGNSGGSLANAQGQVIGINTMIVNGMGFAIPSKGVQQFLHDQRNRPYLGVTLQPVRIRLRNRRAFGLLITAVEAGSPAATARLQMGDVLIGVRGRTFQHPNELFYILENSREGDGLLLEVLRGDRPFVAEVVLCSKDLEAKAA
ncbi:trypsin-like peptidase domain-containing protein [Kovacikia minuta CCNUW1]|uniref:S1C family serine protease n=1 Tax=Kovacikia minuta TaxID=2931930 RepID=UPI001CC948F1|nr:trypsin-like peptidase domain-containing protein [Kovacikia minuta]UBF25040.1 trypsin-like peptidase domain-containing protein [Kovacikia minuta CCNUW1]